MDRNEFMELVYETFADEPDNVLANGIIEAADAYAEHEKAQLFKEGTTSDLISKTETAEHLRRMLEATVPNTDYDEGFVDGVEFGVSTVSTMPTIQPVATDTNVGDTISKFIDGLEEIFADLRERHVDDSVCGLCEYDGAYMGQSGDWCNECPGFDKDDCFKLSDKTRKKWTEEIINALPTIQPEQQWIPVSERLPEKGGEYLVSVHHTIGAISVFHPEKDTYVDDVAIMKYYGKFPSTVRAWMPLPKPFEGGNA